MLEDMTLTVTDTLDTRHLLQMLPEVYSQGGDYILLVYDRV